MIHKHRGNRRRVAYTKGYRKAHIMKDVMGWEESQIPSASKLSKAKVHCSCPLCAAKTKRNMGRRDRSLNSWKISDRRKIIAGINAIQEYNEAC